jgi:sec-independent protein translocase protein TatA
MFGLGTGELVVILAVFALMFGGKRLPELGRGLGQGMRGFRDALKGIDETDAPKSQGPKEGAEANKKPMDPGA